MPALKKYNNVNQHPFTQQKRSRQIMNDLKPIAITSHNPTPAFKDTTTPE